MSLIHPLKIGDIEIENNIIFAPLAGVSCPAYRLLCRKYGAGIAYTQLIDAEGAIHRFSECYDRYVDVLDGERPVVIQIVGNNPEYMKKATEIIDEFADIIDINMGCPESEVLAKKAGAFLMKHPEQIERVVKAVISATNKPVTAKIRSGWDLSSINAIEVAKMLEDYGVAAIAVHARTKQQKFSGEADWNIIKQVKEAVSVPLIGNGDIKSAYHAQKMFNTTGCDAIMIGRAAMGNPIIFKEIHDYIESGIAPAEQTLKDKQRMFLEFYDLYKTQKRQRHPEVLQHALWFFKGTTGAREIKRIICTIKDTQELVDYIKGL